MEKQTVQRSLYYYDIDSLFCKPETDFFDQDKGCEKLYSFFEKIYIGQKENPDAYPVKYITKSNDDLFIQVDSIDDNYIKFEIVLSRKNALPFVEEDRRLEKLSKYIGKSQNIAEVTHCVIFKKYQVMGAEFNHSGARPSAISEYVKNTGRNIICNCRPKIDPEVFSKLDINTDFSLFDFSIRVDSESLKALEAESSLFKHLFSDCKDVDSFEIVLRKRKLKKNGNKGFTPPLSIPKMQELLKMNKDDILKLNVSQTTYKDSIDLLSDRLVTKVYFIKTTDRSIDSRMVYGKIIEFFNTTVKQYCKFV